MKKELVKKTETFEPLPIASIQLFLEAMREVDISSDKIKEALTYILSNE